VPHAADERGAPEEAALETNVNGALRPDGARDERISAKAREEFNKHRSTWGARCATPTRSWAGVSMKGDDDAEILVKVSWFPPRRGGPPPHDPPPEVARLQRRLEAHSRGARIEGDLGLIGETIPGSDNRVSPRSTRSFRPSESARPSRRRAGSRRPFFQHRVCFRHPCLLSAPVCFQDRDR